MWSFRIKESRDRAKQKWSFKLNEKESEKTLRLLLLEQIKVHLFGKIFQNLDAADAVAFFVQRRTKDTDAHAVDQRCRNAAADTAFGRKADGHGKFTGAIIHAAGEHQRTNCFCTFRLDEHLAGGWAGAVICKHCTHLGNVHRSDIDRAHFEVKVQTFLDVAFQNAGGFEVIGKSAVAVASGFFREVDRLGLHDAGAEREQTHGGTDDR